MYVGMRCLFFNIAAAAADVAAAVVQMMIVYEAPYSGDADGAAADVAVVVYQIKLTDVVVVGVVSPWALFA